MCGIAGIINHCDRHNEAEILAGMCGTMRHRGPDGGGTFSAPGILLGHRRLAVIDLASGAQPLYSEDRSLVLVINGEIYNFKELRKELEEKQSEYIQMSAKVEGSLSTAAVEEYARTQLGMTKATNQQKEYISLSQGDKVCVYDDCKGNIFTEIGDFFESLWS